MYIYLIINWSVKRRDTGLVLVCFTPFLVSSYTQRKRLCIRLSLVWEFLSPGYGLLLKVFASGLISFSTGVFKFLSKTSVTRKAFQA